MRKTLLNCAFWVGALHLLAGGIVNAATRINIGPDFKQTYLSEETLDNVSNPNSDAVSTAASFDTLDWKKFELTSGDQPSTIFLGSNQYIQMQVFLKRLPDGDLIAVEEMDYPLISFFKIPVDRGNYEIWLGLKPKAEPEYPTIQIPLQILSPGAFSFQYGYARLFGIFFLGATFLLALYHFILLIITRDLSYFFYFSFIICATFFCLSMNPYLANIFYGKMEPTTGLPFFLGTITLAFHLALFRHIFLLTDSYPLLDTWFNRVFYLIGIFGFIGLLGWTSFSLIILFPLTGIAALAMIWVNLKLIKEMSVSALFFLLGTSFFTFSIMILLGMLLEWLPSTVFGMTIGLQMEIFYILGSVFWAAALSARISQMQKDANEEELENQKLKRKQEQDLLKLLEEQNRELEERVISRTQKLQEKNKELESSIASLHSAQNELIEKEKMASLGQLTAGVAHEINNPINFVSNGISNLKMNYQDLVDALNQYLSLDSSSTTGKAILAIQERNKQFEIDELIEENKILFKSINNGVNRTRKIVNGLSSFSDEGGEHFLPTDIHQCLDSTLEILKNKIKNRVTIDKQYGEISKAVCQESRINQVFLNILNNAAQAIDNEGSISIKTLEEDGFVKIVISDTGSGMDKATQRKIFDPFFTTKEIGVGTGLGLSISYKIIEQHGGSLSFESEKGKGTTFFIKIPVQGNNN